MMTLFCVATILLLVGILCCLIYLIHVCRCIFQSDTDIRSIIQIKEYMRDIIEIEKDVRIWTSRTYGVLHEFVLGFARVCPWKEESKDDL